MKRYSSLSIAAAACIWGSMGLFVRRVEAVGFTPMEIVAIRSLGAFLVLLSYTLLFNKKLLRIRIKDLPIFLGSGVCSITFFNFCYFTTISRTSLSVAAVLLYTAPAFVILFAYLFFKEPITIRKLTALVMSFAGCFFVSGILNNTQELRAVDLLVGIGAGLGYALYSIFSRSALNRGYSSLTITLYTFFFAGLSALPFTEFTDTLRLIGNNRRIWPDLISMVLLVTIIAYVLYTYGLNRLEAGTASIIACIEPVVATCIGLLVYHESISFFELLGITLVLSSSVLVNLPSSRRCKL